MLNNFSDNYSETLNFKETNSNLRHPIYLFLKSKILITRLLNQKT